MTPAEPPAQAPAALAKSLVEDIENAGRAAAGKPPAPKPWARDPEMALGVGEIIETIFPEGSIERINAEYVDLEAALQLDGALTPNAIRDAINGSQRRALRASAIHLLAKLDLSRYERECDVALGAMREAAAAELEKEKEEGLRSKAPTIADIADRAATKFPDEWRDINNSLQRFKRTVDQLEKFSKLWERRSYALAAMGGVRTPTD